ncbi:MAG: hypothetical protein ACYC7B_10985, partial [Burkholderiales bacterium]
MLIEFGRETGHGISKNCMFIQYPEIRPVCLAGILQTGQTGNKQNISAEERADTAGLRHTGKGGTVVCAGIHMSNVPEFPYSILWGERCVRSIANLTRRDGEAFLDIAPRAGIKAEVETFPLASAND